MRYVNGYIIGPGKINFVHKNRREKMKKFKIASTLILATLAFTNFLFAQVTLESVMTSNGFGGKGAFQVKTVTKLKDDAKRTETQFRFTGTIMKHFNRKGTEIEIIRLDKKLIWKFNDQDNKYQETTFDEIKKMFQEGLSEFEWPAEGQPADEGAEERESEYEWQKPVVEVKDLGERKKINGFKCQHYLATVTTIGKHKATGVLDTLLFSTDIWSSVNVGKAMKKISDFDKRVAEELGFSRTSNKGLAQIFNMYKKQMEDLQKEVSKIKGFPIRTEMVITMTKHAMKASGQEEQAEEDETEIALDDIKGTLGGLFGKKLKKAAKKKVAKKPSSKAEIFQAVNEVKNISVGDLPDELFVVQARYKLQE